MQPGSRSDRVAEQLFALPTLFDNEHDRFPLYPGHPFAKGVGIAAPQIGIGRAVAVVQPPSDTSANILLKPRLTDRSDDVDEQYEAALRRPRSRYPPPEDHRRDRPARPSPPCTSAASPASSTMRSTTSTACCTPPACGLASARSRGGVPSDRPGLGIRVGRSWRRSALTLPGGCRSRPRREPRIGITPPAQVRIADDRRVRPRHGRRPRSVGAALHLRQHR